MLLQDLHADQLHDRMNLLRKKLHWVCDDRFCNHSVFFDLNGWTTVFH